MKRIRRLTNNTPGLTRFCASETNGATWNDFGSFEKGNAKKELTCTLVFLQHGLCAYCETALIADERQIEHFIPRSNAKEGKAKMFDCSNLLACCKGGSNRNFAEDALNRPEYYLEPRKDNLSCGALKGDTAAGKYIDPRDIPSTPALLRVLADGYVETCKDTCIKLGISPSFVDEHIDHLGLNVGRLRNQRRKIMLAFEIPDVDGDTLIALARRELLPDANANLSPFFSTTRSFFGLLAESILAQANEIWV